MEKKLANRQLLSLITLIINFKCILIKIFKLILYDI